MAKSISVRQKKRGRPATGKMPTATLRLPESLSEKIDTWAQKQVDAPGHSEAIRRLVELGLTVKTPARPASKTGRRLRARELATTAIEKIIDPAAPPEEQARRRRRLTKGPTEFREARVDQPKVKTK
jgi:Arc/MetJ-type ribon-helix-helix transcriptional regulator